MEGGVTGRLRGGPLRLHTPTWVLGSGLEPSSTTSCVILSKHQPPRPPPRGLRTASLNTGQPPLPPSGQLRAGNTAQVHR